MALANEVYSMKEVLDDQAHVWNHTFNFINSMALKAAIQLGIPDAIHSHGKPITLSELADALPINTAKSSELYRLMRILVHSKFFDTIKVGGDEAYCLNLASRLLLRDETTSMAPCVLALLIDVLMYYSSGRERTEKEWANLFFTAGFTTYKIYSVLDLRSVIEVFP